MSARCQYSKAGLGASCSSTSASTARPLARLARLNLFNNRISSAGACALAGAIFSRGLPSLAFFHLGGNEVADEGGVPLVSSLAQESVPALAEVFPRQPF